MGTAFERPVGRSPASDPQRTRLYRMESEAIGSQYYNTMPRRMMVKLLRSLARNYAIPEPRPRFKDLGDWTAEWRSDGVITFNPSRRGFNSIVTVAHEFSHHLHAHLALERAFEQQPHGPQFMACYMSVLDTTRAIPVCGMRAICARYKIEFADPGDRNSLTALQRVVRSRG